MAIDIIFDLRYIRFSRQNPFRETAGKLSDRVIQSCWQIAACAQSERDAGLGNTNTCWWTGRPSSRGKQDCLLIMLQCAVGDEACSDTLSNHRRNLHEGLIR